ncbi:Cyanobacterial aminoacyl-tRNA synthetase CAAD domain [Arabidopsis suecica]|uniref:Cyanobacterial aminoacyl-tRNA synthetase CAAD domain n=1 Tax=Arabidopsis suecica TaxID=45249 RepID=A0A8T1YEX6_ARASU|nr:Cyanobacterial aminoacyl-tRNA synthetase CAAD domain [Arabidopsis suecica]
MELSTRSTTVTTHLPWSINGHGYLAGKSVHRISLLPLHRNVASLVLQSRTLRCSRKFPGETVSEETSTGVNEFGLEDRDGVVVAVEEKTSNSEAPQAEDDQTQALEFLNDIKLDSDKTYSILLYGSGAIVALYLTSAIVSSLEAIPLFPKLMEVVGLGYTLWFSTRYLLFKRNREELKTKVSEIKKQVLGSDSE